MLKIRHPIQDKEATQIACRIVEGYGGHINFCRLMQLLYVFEREAWDKLEHPAIGGAYFSTQAGPMISELGDTAKLGRFQIWSTHLSKKAQGEAAEVCLLGPAGRDDISDALLAIIDSVIERTRAWKNQRLQMYCRNLEEYKQPSSPKPKLFVTRV